MASVCTNPRVHFLPVPKADHFTVLDPLNQIFAGWIVQDTGVETNVESRFMDMIKPKPPKP